MAELKIMDLNEIKFEYLKAQGPGGQHCQKNATTVRATHVPSGKQVIVRGRHRERNKQVALRKLDHIFLASEALCRAACKKQHRDHAIHNTPIVRTYNFPRGIVKDHRTKRVAPLKEVLGKGRIELLHA